MKTKLSISLILFALSVLTKGQEINHKNTENCFSVFVESPFFYKDWWEYEHSVVSVNLEYLLRSKNNPGLSLVLGYGEIIEYYEGIYYLDPYVHTEITKLFGRKNHFFELGGGGGYASSVFLNLRLGYRLELGKRFLFRVAFTPAFYPRMHIDTEEHPEFTGFNAISVGLGYRFGIHIPKETRNTKLKRLYGLQFDFQPFFQSYNGGKGYNGNLFLEILIHKTEKLRLTSGLGFGYGNAKYAYNSVPFGVSLLYGRNKHFLETGIKSVWIPIGGNSDGTFFTLQPELGYRIHLWKHFMARVAYTPYWWLSDKKGRNYIEKKYVNSVTVGVGVRFH